MGNPIKSLISGFGHVVGGLFGSPLDFLSGKSCSSLCGPTWDLECYIENFCIEHLLKFFAVSLLLYIVLLLLYFLYKLGVFHCIFRTCFKMIRACFSTVFSFWEHACHWLCRVLSSLDNMHRRRRRKRDIEMAEIISIRSDEEDTDMDTSVSYHGEGYRGRRRMWSRDHKRNHMRKLLRARSHQVRVGVDSGDSVYVTKRKHIRHGDVRVIRTSNFAKKAPSHKKSRRLHNNT